MTNILLLGSGFSKNWGVPVRATTSTAAKRDHVRGNNRVSFAHAAGPNDYSHNIQVAEVTFNGREVSVFPSIGNWNLPCRSHYWITRSRVEWDEQWSAERIAAGFARDRADKERYYRRAPQPHVVRDSGEPEVTRPEKRRSLWERIKGWF